MRQKLKFTLLSLALLFTFALGVPKAEASRPFLMSCAYGTIAGTLVGTASLAFTDKPGDNLNNIARGASLGLYAGIVLGLYVLYGSSGDEATRESAAFANPRLWLEPVIREAQPLGVLAHLNVHNF